MKRALLIFSLSALPVGAWAGNGERAGVRCLQPTAAITAIVGESAGCPYPVKLAVAEAIRNRMMAGTGLRGVYGLSAAHNATEPAWVWRDAARAWQSAILNPQSSLVHGATHFGNAADVRKGTFRGMKLCLIAGTGKHATYFFK